MPTMSRISTFCVAGLLVARFAMGNPILTPRAGEKVAERLPKDIRRGTCAENYDATTEEQRKKLFNEHGNGWELVDRYLDLNDGDNGNTNNWAQEIYLDLFPGEGSGQFECSGETDKCVTTKECKDFEAAGWPGFFYVFKSLEYLSEYLQTYSSNVDQLDKTLQQDTPSLINLMKIGTEDAKKIGMGKILSGGMGVLSGLTAANPLVSGPFAMASGLFTIFEEYLDGDDESGLGEDAKEVLKEMVKKYTVRMKRDVQVLKNAIFGYTNYHTFTNERLVPDEFRDIPKEMQLKGGDPGVDDGWNHAITYVIGDGRWYVQEPAAGLSEKFGELYKRIMQMLAIQIVRQGHGGVVVINDGDDTLNKCNAQTNNVWDPDRNFCYGIMWLDDQRGLKGGINDVAHPLWKEFDRVNLKGLGLDKLETYRSMLDCWESNDANFGEPNPRELPEGGKIPRCFFSMEFKKGYWVDSKKDCWGGATIELNYSLKNSDRVFPNFPKDSAEQTNRRTNWPQTQKIQSLTCN